MPDAQKKAPIDESLFNMWRCVAALAHVDGEVQTQERVYLERIFSNLERVYALTDAQKQELRDDLETAHAPSEFLHLVTSPESRATLTHFCRILAAADGSLDPDEEDVIKKLTQDDDAVALNPDFRAYLHQSLEKSDLETKAALEKARADVRGKSPLFTALDSILLRFGIDMLD